MQVTGQVAPPSRRMNVVTVGDPVLEEPSQPVARFNRSLWKLLDRMVATMYHQRGVGLAAVQVGVPQRIVVVDYGEGLMELVNPEITHRAGSEKGFEGCLSVPGYMGEVTRPTEVTVTAQDREGDRIFVDVEGWAARVLCHEIDHLDGNLFIDRSEDIVPMAPRTRLRVVFMGTPEFAATVLREMIGANSAVVGAVTAPDRPGGRGQRPAPSPVKTLALASRVPVLQPESSADHPDLVRHLTWLEPDLIVTAAYGQILRKEILDLPRLGCINVHASLLPRYRGAAPIQRLLMAGETETGVTIISMDEGMDTGPILLQCALPVLEEDDAGTLHDRLAALGGDMVLEVMDRLARGEIEPEPQDDDLATYAPKISRDETEIDWSRTARDIVNQVRAFSPRPGAWTMWNGDRIKILLASEDDGSGGAGEVLTVAPGGIRVGTGEGTCVLGRIQVPGRRPIPVEAFVNGYDMKPGEILGGAGEGAHG